MRVQTLLLGAALIVGVICGCNSLRSTEPHVPSYGELPGPPINTLEIVRSDSGTTSRSRGTVDIHLSRDNASRTFWNDPDTRTDPWGTITLLEVRGDKTVLIYFGNQYLSARPGEAFPGTGIVVVTVDPEAGTAWLRSKWKHTVWGMDAEQLRRLQNRPRAGR